MKTKSKVLPYVVFGVPILVGLYFVYRAIRKGRKGKDSTKEGGYNANTSSSVTKTTSGNTVTVTPKVVQYFPLKKGSKGAKVKDLQNALIVLGRTEVGTPDGDFGSNTEKGLVNETGKKSVESQSELDALIKKSGDKQLQQQSYNNNSGLSQKLIDAFNESIYRKPAFDVIKTTSVSYYNVTSDGRSIFEKNVNASVGDKLPLYGAFTDKEELKIELYVSASGWIVLAYNPEGGSKRVKRVFDPNDVQVVSYWS